MAAISLLVSGFSAVTAFRGFRHSRRTAHTQLRAWLCYENTGIELRSLPDGSRELAFHVDWKNAGSTPALGVQIIMLGMAFTSPDEAKRHKFEDVQVDPEISGVVGPGITVDSPTGTFRLPDFRSGSTVLFSKVTYKDIFSDKLRETDIRLLITAHHVSETKTTFVYQAVGGGKAT